MQGKFAYARQICGCEGKSKDAKANLRMRAQICGCEDFLNEPNKFKFELSIFQDFSYLCFAPGSKVINLKNGSSGTPDFDPQATVKSRVLL
jgi:hypothetical protein